jgi:hypothetical protein
LAFAGRDCIYADGSITKYSVFNTAKAEYTSGQIAHIEFSVQSRRGYSPSNIPRYLRSKTLYVSMTITTTDNQEFYIRSTRFSNDGYTDWIDYMQQIKDLYPEEMITCHTDGIEAFILHKQLDENDQARLYKLFNLEP